MKPQELVDKFYKINLALFNKAANPLMCHGPDHHLRVTLNALLLAKKLKAKTIKVDFEILIAAGFLHDLTAYDAHMASEKHHAESKKLAQKILKKINFPQEKRQGVLEAIAGHGSDPKYHQIDEAMETTLLRDADKMDVFGPIGVARMIMARAKRGDNLEEILHKFYGRYTKRKWQAIKTPAAKKITHQDYLYSVEFFKKLKKDLDKFRKK
jgi:HD superfamily phosphodiesterase